MHRGPSARPLVPTRIRRAKVISLPGQPLEEVTISPILPAGVAEDCEQAPADRICRKGVNTEADTASPVPGTSLETQGASRRVGDWAGKVPVAIVSQALPDFGSSVLTGSYRNVQGAVPTIRPKDPRHGVGRCGLGSVHPDAGQNTRRRALRKPLIRGAAHHGKEGRQRPHACAATAFSDRTTVSNCSPSHLSPCPGCFYHSRALHRKECHRASRTQPPRPRTTRRASAAGAA